MKPVAARVEGFRRFGSPNVNMNLADGLIAVVGPNEAGKTSFLEALARVEDDEAVKGMDLTRGGTGRVRIRVTYELDDVDRDSVTGSFGAEAASGLLRIHYTKEEDGQRYYGLDPELPAVEDGRPVKRRTVSDGTCRSSEWPEAVSQSGRLVFTGRPGTHGRGLVLAPHT